MFLDNGQRQNINTIRLAPKVKKSSVSSLQRGKPAWLKLLCEVDIEAGVALSVDGSAETKYEVVVGNEVEA